MCSYEKKLAYQKGSWDNGKYRMQPPVILQCRYWHIYISALIVVTALPLMTISSVQNNICPTPVQFWPVPQWSSNMPPCWKSSWPCIASGHVCRQECRYYHHQSLHSDTRDSEITHPPQKVTFYRVGLISPARETASLWEISIFLWPETEPDLGINEPDWHDQRCRQHCLVSFQWKRAFFPPLACLLIRHKMLLKEYFMTKPWLLNSTWMIASVLWDITVLIAKFKSSKKFN